MPYDKEISKAGVVGGAIEYSNNHHQIIINKKKSATEKTNMIAYPWMKNESSISQTLNVW